ncbi:hypothetical protein HNQ02_003753 [Flavobacterium sp. 7E]|uniref:DUF4365 domain-containing protein n=1 Tax=Flavobacterium sp. 7E TaxID=2735898 RepID=UPI00156D6308|nr:DUF4365 domain-containing protein [Flavobacterium sp. 7E]NRS90806.1 hypothetical protein [Flavobacterium sp. 7E]
MSNEIGELGETLFNLAISRDYIFRPRHLGEKWPASDFYVELIGPTEVFFFIVQVKATHSGLNNKGNLKIKVPKQKLHDLNSYFCPTYVAGVDNDSEEVYLVSINTNRRKGISSLPTKFILNKQNRIKLFNEVKDFWLNSNIKNYKRNFNHKI